MTAVHARIHRHLTSRLSADERRAEVVEAAVKAFAVGGYAGTPETSDTLAIRRAYSERT